MSWSGGSDIFLKVLPIIKDEIKDDKHRADFLVDFVSILIGHDMDPYDIEGFDKEVDAAVKRYYE